LVAKETYDVVYFLMQGLHLLTGLAMIRDAWQARHYENLGSGRIPLMRASREGVLN